jgi:hypothetical protein
MHRWGQEQDIGADNWCADELAGIELGDKRLNVRVIDTIGRLAAQPQAPINQACHDWADAKASYRLFQNERVTPEGILEPHQRRTRERMQGHRVVLAVQDTTYLDFTTHKKTKGLGPTGTSSDSSGLVMHLTMAMVPTGLPLGVLTQEIWARDSEVEPKDDWERRKQPIEEKESHKWLTALRETAKLTPLGVQVVSVCDREGDVYELFVEAERLGAGLLVRAAQDRAVEGGAVHRLWARGLAARVSGYLKVTVPARDKEPEREAIVSVRYGRVTLKPPWRSQRCQPLPRIALHMVLVREDEAPEEGRRLEWLLLTNVRVVDFEDAIERISWYRCRWLIEIFFRVLKTGCRVEHCRLGTADRLKRFIVLLCIVAWRLYWLTHFSRYARDAPCTLILADHEWKALYVRINRTSPSGIDAPTVSQVVHWVARLGGFLDRKGDGEPGPTAIWRGWQRLRDISDTWLLLQTCG